MHARASSPSWFEEALCCGPFSQRLFREGRHKHVSLRRDEKSVTGVWSDEPGLTISPSLRPHPRPVSHPRADRTAGRTETNAYWSRRMPQGQSAKNSTSSRRHRHRSHHVYSRSDSSTLVEPRFAPPPGKLKRSRHLIWRRMRASILSGSRFSSLVSLSAKTRASRRPQISAPTDFRHLESSSFSFPVVTNKEQQSQQEIQTCRKLPPPAHLQRGSVHHNIDDASGEDEKNGDYTTTAPLRVHIRNSNRDEDACESPAMQSRHPRRLAVVEDNRSGPVNSDCHETCQKSQGESARPLDIPEFSRLRPHSSPADVGRVASLKVEMEKLHAEIDSAAEGRAPLMIHSRPSTAYQMFTNKDMPQPWMLFPSTFHEAPTVPAIPSTAPSFAERLCIERPRTAPPRTSTYRERQRSAALEPTTTTSVSPVSMTFAASIAAAAAKVTRAKRSASAQRYESNNGMASSTNVSVATTLPLLHTPLRKKKPFYHKAPRLSLAGDDSQEKMSRSADDTGYARGLNFASVTSTPTLTSAATMTALTTPLTTPTILSEADASLAAVILKTGASA